MNRRDLFRCWRVLPIIGGLPFSTRKAHKEAAKEIGLTILFSALPLLIPFFIALSWPKLHVDSFINRSLGEGELYLYAAAFVGPLIYSVFKNREADQGKDVEAQSRTNDDEILPEDPAKPTLSIMFPDGLWFMLASALIILISVIAISFVKIEPIAQLLGTEQDPHATHISYGVFIASAICLYASSVYRNDLEKSDGLFRSGERAFFKRWKKR